MKRELGCLKKKNNILMNMPKNYTIQSRYNLKNHFFDVLGKDISVIPFV